MARGSSTLPIRTKRRPFKAVFFIKIAILRSQFKESRLMKRFALLFFVLFPAIIIHSGDCFGKSRKQAYVPKHEFSIQGGCSYNTIYMAKSGDETIERGKYRPASMKFSPLLPAGFEYTYHFDSHWGITTGFGLSHHPYFNNGSTGTHTVVEPGTYPHANSNKAVFHQYVFEDESLDFVLDYITIPILGKYMFPVGKGFQLYTQAGFRLGLLLAAEMDFATGSNGCSLTEMTLDGSTKESYIPLDNFEAQLCSIDDELMFSHGRSVGGGEEDEVRYFRPVNLYSSLEAGVRIPVYGSLGLYLGGFVDVGMIRPVSSQKNIYPVMSEGRRVSVPLLENWCAVQDMSITKDKDNYVVTANQQPFIKRVIPLSAGLKFKIAF